MLRSFEWSYFVFNFYLRITGYVDYVGKVYLNHPIVCHSSSSHHLLSFIRQCSSLPPLSVIAIALILIGVQAFLLVLVLLQILYYYFVCPRPHHFPIICPC